MVFEKNTQTKKSKKGPQVYIMGFVVALTPLFVIFGLVVAMLYAWNKEEPNKREDNNE